MPLLLAQLLLLADTSRPAPLATAATLLRGLSPPEARPQPTRTLTLTLTPTLTLTLPLTLSLTPTLTLTLTLTLSPITLPLTIVEELLDLLCPNSTLTLVLTLTLTLPLPLTLWQSYWISCALTLNPALTTAIFDALKVGVAAVEW